MSGENEAPVQAGHFEVSDPISVSAPYWLYPAASSVEPWIWRPHPDLEGELPKDWSLAFGCVRENNGDRLFLPLDLLNQAGNPERFVAKAFLGGLPILQRTRGLDADGLFSYRLMWLLARWGRRRDAFFHNVFRYWKDLLISPGGIDDDLVDPGAKPAYKMRKVTVIDTVFGAWDKSRIEEAGQQAARTRGIEKPTIDQIIQFGLLKVASQATKLKLPPPRNLVSAAFLNTTLNDDDLKDCLKHRAMAPLRRLLMKHMADSKEEFDKWFWGPKSNIVTQLCRLKSIKPALEKEAARTFLLTLVFRSFQFLADSTQELMAKVGGAIYPALNERETSAFKTLYFNHNYLADLSAVVLNDRWPLIFPILREIWTDPANKKPIRLLHGALFLYGWIARARRDADTRRKRRKKGPKRAPLELDEIGDPMAVDPADAADELLCMELFEDPNQSDLSEDLY